MFQRILCIGVLFYSIVIFCDPWDEDVKRIRSYYGDGLQINLSTKMAFKKDVLSRFKQQQSPFWYDATQYSVEVADIGTHAGQIRIVSPEVKAYFFYSKEGYFVSLLQDMSYGAYSGNNPDFPYDSPVNKIVSNNPSYDLPQDPTDFAFFAFGQSSSLPTQILQENSNNIERQPHNQNLDALQKLFERKPTSPVDPALNAQLFKAVESGDRQVVFELVFVQGVSVNQTDMYGLSSLDIAVNNNDSEMAGTLLGLGATPAIARNAIWYAIYEGNTGVLQTLLERGADPNQPSPDGLWTTPLAYVCASTTMHLTQTQKNAMAKLLVKRGGW